MSSAAIFLCTLRVKALNMDLQMVVIMLSLMSTHRPVCFSSINPFQKGSSV